MHLRAPLVALALALPFAAHARNPDDLVIGVAQFPSSLHPDIDPEVIRNYALDFSLRPITAFDKDWKNTCLLCTDLPTLENGLARIEDRPDGAKGMAVTIKLKPGLAWADGQPVTAHDIAFTWKLGANPASGFSNTHPWGRADKVDVVDDQTAILHLKTIDVSYNEWDQILPEHIEGPIAEKATDPAAYIQSTAYNKAPTTAGLWDGPYMLTAYQSNQQIVFQPNPHWSGAKPYFQTITLRFIENTAALQANLLSGDVDMVAGEGVGLTIDQVLSLRHQHPDQFTYIFKPSLTYEHVDLNRDNPILTDVRVRRALLMALDRDTLVKKLFEGMQPVANTWVNPLDTMFDKSIPEVGYDTAAARTLLAEAGWRPGPDGICRDQDGKRLQLVFTTTAGNRLRELQEQVLQSEWKAACVDVQIKNEPPRTLFGDTLKHRTFTGLVMYAWSSAVGESPRRTLGSDNIPTAANNYSGANYVAFNDPKMDADIKAAESELDAAKRKAIWAEMQHIYADQLPVLPLFFRADAHVIPKWLQGYEPTGHGDFTPLWVENWTRQ